MPPRRRKPEPPAYGPRLPPGAYPLQLEHFRREVRPGDRPEVVRAIHSLNIFRELTECSSRAEALAVFDRTASAWGPHHTAYVLEHFGEE